MTVILFDAKNCLYRFGFAHFGLASADSVPTGALYGMLDVIMRLKKKYADGRFVMVWDGAGRSWRHRVYDGYKGNRTQDEKAKVVLDQAKHLRRVTEMIGIPNVSVRRVEADDLVAMVAMKAVQAGHDAVVYSTDCDFYQLMAFDVQLIRNGTAVETVKSTRERFGCRPGEVLAVRSLAGDKSDNIPNICRGIGLKRAADMVAAGMVKTMMRLPAGQREVVQRNLKLMRLVTEPGSYPAKKRRSELQAAVTAVFNGLAMPRRGSYTALLNTLTRFNLAEAVAERHTLWRVQV